MSQQNEIDLSPATTRGQIRGSNYVAEIMRPNTAVSSRQDGQLERSMIERVLSAPAPVPGRDMRISERQRLEGAVEKSTPIMRAIATLLRSLPIMAVLVFVGITGYVVVGHGDMVTISTVLACLVTLAIFNILEYRHSQPGVERQRARLDHKLEMTHEENRHYETITAITGDLELKNKIIDASIQKMLGG